MSTWAWTAVGLGAPMLDDALVVALVLRLLLRGAGRELVRERWPGPDRSLALVERLVC